MPLPTILINAYARPTSLQRLLDSLGRAHIPGGVRLHISIDGGGDPEVARIAKEFAWTHGEKHVHIHDKNLGLVEHFLRCGGLTRSLGDIVYLEDDLVVSRQFYAYARQAFAVYGDDRTIAGISLNRLPINGYTRHPFTPIPGRGDAFFAQVYWYQGQVYSARMWSDFERWWREEKRPISPSDGLHPVFLPHARWENDFFPAAMLYLHQTGRLFAFPYESHTTQFGDPGTHFNQRTDLYQVPLQHEREHFNFTAPDDTRAVYDSFQEIRPEMLAKALPEADFDVDLNGTKPLAALKKDHVLTIRPVRKALHSFGLQMRPAELNVQEHVPGIDISLALRADLRMDSFSELKTAAKLHRYHHPGRSAWMRELAFRLIERH
jgi:hypothetical protein